MGLFGSSDIENQVESSVEEIREHSDSVEVDDLRSPEELIDQVDRLEEIVEGLRERQNEMLDNRGEKPEDSVFRRNNVEKDVEDRLELLEVAVERLEAGLEFTADELRDEIVEEVIDYEEFNFGKIEEKLDEIDDKAGSEDVQRAVQELKDELMSEIDRKSSEVKSEVVSRVDQVEEEVVKLESENTRFSDSLERMRRRVRALEDEGSEEKVDREEFDELREQVEQMSEVLSEVARKSQHS